MVPAGCKSPILGFGAHCCFHEQVPQVRWLITGPFIFSAMKSGCGAVWFTLGLTDHMLVLEANVPSCDIKHCKSPYPRLPYQLTQQPGKGYFVLWRERIPFAVMSGISVCVFKRHLTLNIGSNNKNKQVYCGFMVLYILQKELRA